MLPDNVTVRLATLADAAEIAGLSRELIETGLGWSWTRARVARNIASSSTTTLVACDGERLIGFAIMYFGDEHAHLSLLAVRPAYQRVGRRDGIWSNGWRSRRSPPASARSASSCAPPTAAPGGSTGASASPRSAACRSTTAASRPRCAWRATSGAAPTRRCPTGGGCSAAEPPAQPRRGTRASRRRSHGPRRRPRAQGLERRRGLAVPGAGDVAGRRGSARTGCRRVPQRRRRPRAARRDGGARRRDPVAGSDVREHRATRRARAAGAAARSVEPRAAARRGRARAALRGVPGGRGRTPFTSTGFATWTRACCRSCSISTRRGTRRTAASSGCTSKPGRERRSSTSPRTAARSSSSFRTGSRTRCCPRGASG